MRDDPVNGVDPIGRERADQNANDIGSDCTAHNDRCPGSTTFNVPQLVGTITITYGESGVSLIVDNPIYNAQGSTNGKAFDFSGQLANMSEAISKNGNKLALSGKIGSSAYDFTKDSNGMSITARALGWTKTFNARTVQVEKVPTEVSGRDGTHSARTGEPEPSTKGQWMMELVRQVVSLLDPWSPK